MPAIVRWLAVTVAIALPWLALAPRPAAGAVGSAVSPPTIVDTIAPVVTLAPQSEHMLLQGGDIHTFAWTTTDIHPGTTAADFGAVIEDGSVPLAAIDYLAEFAAATWDFEAPEISSGYLHLVVTCRDAFGNTSVAQGPDFSVILSTSDAPGPDLPPAAVLDGNQPNPFNPGTTVRFRLPRDQAVRLDLYSAAGMRVRRLASGVLEAGTHEIFWDGRDERGRDVASGTYLLRLETGDAALTRKLALVR